MAQLTAAEEAELASLEAEFLNTEARQEAQDRQERLRMMAEARGGGASAGPVETQTYATGIRYGVPLVTGLATGGLGMLPMMAAGAASALTGETAAQTVEKLGLGEEYRPRQMVGATIRGAAPVFKAAPFTKVPFLQSAPVKTAAASGMAGLLGGAAEGRVEGPLTALKEFGLGFVPVAGLQLGGEMLGYGTQKLTEGMSRARQLERIGPGVEPTIGQAFPSLAGLETRVAAQTGSQELKGQLERQANAITQAVIRVSGIPAEKYPDIVQRVAGEIGNFSPETLSRLSDEASNITRIEDAIGKARSEAQKSLLQESLNDAKASFTKAIRRQTMPSVADFRSAEMGRRTEDIVQQTRDAFKTKANELYAPTNAFEDQLAFNIDAPSTPGGASLRREASDLINKIPDIPAGGLTELNKIMARRKTVAAPYSPDPTAPVTISVPEKASLAELRAIRDELYDFADTSGEAIGKNAQREVRNLGQRITETIDSQADAAFGAANANALREANKFYADFRPRFDEFGVIQAFKPERMETAQMAETLRGRVAGQGVETPAFKNPVSLLEDLQARGVAGVPNPGELSQITRSGIVDRSVDAATGDIDFTKLASDLNSIERTSPGSLAKLGFGSRDELNRFIRFTERLPEAQTTGPEAILKLLQTETPAGTAVASRAISALPDVATLDTVMNALQKRATAGSKSASDALLNVRARQIEDLLLDIQQGTQQRGASIGAIGELANPDTRWKYERILGPKLLSSIEKQFLPGFKIISEAKQAAGQAGSTVRGAALERIGKQAAQLPIEVAAGTGTSGLIQWLSSVGDALGYATVSKVLAKGAGVSGLRSRRDFIRDMELIAKNPDRSRQVQLLRRYAGEDSEE